MSKFQVGDFVRPTKEGGKRYNQTNHDLKSAMVTELNSKLGLYMFDDAPSLTIHILDHVNDVLNGEEFVVRQCDFELVNDEEPTGKGMSVLDMNNELEWITNVNTDDLTLEQQFMFTKAVEDFAKAIRKIRTNEVSILDILSDI